MVQRCQVLFDMLFLWEFNFVNGYIFVTILQEFHSKKHFPGLHYLEDTEGYPCGFGQTYLIWPK